MHGIPWGVVGERKGIGEREMHRILWIKLNEEFSFVIAMDLLDKV